MSDEQYNSHENYGQVADQLSEATEAVRRADYNTLTEAELAELLDAVETIESLCLEYRRNDRAD